MTHLQSPSNSCTHNIVTQSRLDQALILCLHTIHYALQGYKGLRLLPLRAWKPSISTTLLNAFDSSLNVLRRNVAIHCLCRDNNLSDTLQFVRDCQFLLDICSKIDGIKNPEKVAISNCHFTAGRYKRDDNALMVNMFCAYINPFGTNLRNAGMLVA